MQWIAERHRLLDSGRVREYDEANSTAAPGLLWLFGEKGCRKVTFFIDLKGGPSDQYAQTYDTDLFQELIDAKRLFPEAIVSVDRVFSLSDPNVPEVIPDLPALPMLR